ncbi:MAG: histidine kinase dimerization/phospho-acceptor domain-containing protein, partial [Cyanobacteria bacterium J06606_4]
DFTLADINAFLQTLEISPSGEAFILNRQGELIASSFIESPFNSQAKPLRVEETRNKLIEETGNFLLERFGDFDNVTRAYSLDYEDGRGRQMLQVRPFSDNFGLDWLVVVVVPESDFTGTIRENSRMTLLLSLAIVGVTVLLVSLIARRLSRAILTLSQASQRIAAGNLSQQIPASNIQELHTVARSFNRMSQDLQHSYARLEDYSLTLENKVQQRTQALEKEMHDRALSEQRYYSLFEDSPIALWEEDFSLVKAYLLEMNVLPNGKDFKAYFDEHSDVLRECIQQVRVLEVNQSALDLFDAKQKEDLLARLDNDHDTAALEGFKQELAALCEGKTRLELELVNYTLTGKKKHILFKEFVAPGYEQTWGRVLISMLDISDRKRAEAALQQQSDIDNLLSQVSCAFLEKEIDTAIEFALQKLGEFTGSDRARIFQFQKRGPGQDQFRLTHRWRQSEVVPYLAERKCIDASTYTWFYHKLLAGNPFQIIDVAELPPEAAASQAVFAEHNIRSLLDVPMVYCGQSVGFIALDTTERARTWTPSEVNVVKLIGEMVAMAQAKHSVEQALLQAKEDAEIANRAKSDFLANMSHELRSPLNAILGFAAVMHRSRLLPEEHRDDVQIISRSGEYLLSQINDVLDMSKIEAGRVELVPTAFNLFSLLDDLVGLFKLRAEEKQLQLTIDRGPDLPDYIRADQAKLRQVLINLLNNAVKFTNTGGITLGVTLESALERGLLSTASTNEARSMSLSFS